MMKHVQPSGSSGVGGEVASRLCAMLGAIVIVDFDDSFITKVWSVDHYVQCKDPLCQITLMQWVRLATEVTKEFKLKIQNYF